MGGGGGDNLPSLKNMDIFFSCTNLGARLQSSTKHQATDTAKSVDTDLGHDAGVGEVMQEEFLQ